jgi:hypothetical protein
MVTTDEIRLNVFASWVDRLTDHFGRVLTKPEVAALIGKTVRSVDLYLSGKQQVPLDTLYLMQAIEQGFRPKKPLKT